MTWGREFGVQSLGGDMGTARSRNAQDLDCNLDGVLEGEQRVGGRAWGAGSGWKTLT